MIRCTVSMPGRTHGARRAPGQGGIILMEALAAAAILAVAALALITVRQRCIQREASSALLLVATRVAECLVAEVAVEPVIVPTTEEGEVGDLPEGTYRREVELKSDSQSAQLLRIHVAVSYDADGRERTFGLEKWVYRSRGDTTNQ